MIPKMNHKPSSTASIASLMAVAVLALAACSSTPEQKAPAPEPAAAPAPAAPATPSAPAAVTPPPATLAAHLDPNNPIYRERSVFFDFDEAVITPKWQPVVERQGQYLAKNSALKVRVEGNTDERGGSEYNLALGQRRAEAVKKALELYGVKDAQVETVSFGKERPKATGHDETAWAQNRRADIVYK
jgi:peptidoglycan-associated lipoprotein